MAQAVGKSVRITLNFKRDVDGVPVYFKSDGQRFDQTTTIKFQLDEAYRVDVTIRPAIPVESLRFQDDAINLEKITKFIDPNALSYTGVWKTSGFPLTDKSRREKVKVDIFLKGANFLSILQCKFYDHAENQHSRWGDKLNFIEWEGTIPADGTILIQKQQIA